MYGKTFLEFSCCRSRFGTVIAIAIASAIAIAIAVAVATCVVPDCWSCAFSHDFSVQIKA